MESQMEKENCRTGGWTAGMMFQITGVKEEGEWIETDDDCARFCRCFGPDEFEFVQINRYLSDTVFYTISHGTVCLQDYFMEQIDSILKSYGYQNLNYGTYGISVEPIFDSQLIAEMVFETYFKEFEEERRYSGYVIAEKRIKEIINKKQEKAEAVR